MTTHTHESSARREAAQRGAIEQELLAWMAAPTWVADEARFDRLARALFAHQFEHCTPYRRFCEVRGASPDAIASWRDVPAVPTGAFKEIALRCFPDEHTSKTFRTSGTSAERRGALHLDTLTLYEASLLASLRTLFVADIAAPHEAGEGRIAMQVLAPSGDEAPDSSLSHMFDVLLREHGAVGSGYAVRAGRLDVDAVVAATSNAERTRAPIVLLGTAFSFVHLLEALDEDGRRLACPPGSRVMETGGFKGRSRELPRAELHAWLADRLGVPEAHIVNQYGMTELGSQFYDSVLVDPAGPRRKLGPPWARVRFVDPETGRDAAPGDVGMVVVHDLANTGSVAAVETADLGRAILDRAGEPIGFEVLGREPGAESRGCSIAADAMLTDSGR